MGHVKLGKERRFVFDFALPVTQTETEKRYLVTVTLAALTFQMTSVIPPLGFEIGMGIVIGGESKFAPG